MRLAGASEEHRVSCLCGAVASDAIPSGPVRPRRTSWRLPLPSGRHGTRPDSRRPSWPRAGLSVRALQRTEQGQRRTALGDAVAIAQALGRSLDELVHLAESSTFEAPAMGRPRGD